MKRILLSVLVLILVLVAILLTRTFLATSRQVTVAQSAEVRVTDSVIGHLQKAITFRTISLESGKVDTAEFTNFHAFLATAFPMLHAQANLEKINDFSLLFHIKGKDASVKPIILMGHQDVVPVEDAALALWKVAPFSGGIVNDSIYGRGTVDDKGSVMAILEAAEQLLRESYQPAGDVYIALGHDEEVIGQYGAKNIVPILKQRNVQPAFVVDEGGMITSKEIKSVTKPIALIGIAEKGFVTADLTINITGGHSSMPAEETAIDQLSKAIVKLKENQFPSTLQYTQPFMDYIGPEMPFGQRMAFANKWLLSSVIKNVYNSSRGGAAMLRTTTAPTIMNAGFKDNVIPTLATASVNFRTLPGTTIEEVVAHIKTVIEDDRIVIKIRPVSSLPEAIADVNDLAFTYMQKAIRSWRNDVIVAPYLVVGATDGRFFTALTPNVYRFLPFNDVQGFHGINERVGINEYKKAIGFYYGLIKGWR